MCFCIPSLLAPSVHSVGFPARVWGLDFPDPYSHAHHDVGGFLIPNCSMKYTPPSFVHLLLVEPCHYEVCKGSGLDLRVEGCLSVGLQVVQIQDFWLPASNPECLASRCDSFLKPQHSIIQAGCQCLKTVGTLDPGSRKSDSGPRQKCGLSSWGRGPKHLSFRCDSGGHQDFGTRTHPDSRLKGGLLNPEKPYRL